VRGVILNAAALVVTLFRSTAKKSGAFLETTAFIDEAISVDYRFRLQLTPLWFAGHLYEFFTIPLQAFGNFLFGPVNLPIMKLNARKPFQLGAVLLALTMLTSYVVYSQRQVAPTMAPSSKSIILERTAITMETAGTNTVLLRSKVGVAPSSEHMAPVLTIPSTNSSKATKDGVPKVRSPMLFPGSKSGAIFHPGDVVVLLPTPIEQVPPVSEPLLQPRKAPKQSAYSANTNTTETLWAGPCKRAPQMEERNTEFPR